MAAATAPSRKVGQLAVALLVFAGVFLGEALAAAEGALAIMSFSTNACCCLKNFCANEKFTSIISCIVGGSADASAAGGGDAAIHAVVAAIDLKKLSWFSASAAK
jgi:hypothetical protein